MDFARRRWLRFSLRSLLVLVTLVCLWLGWTAHKVSERNKFIDYVTKSDEASDLSLPVLAVLDGKKDKPPLTWRLLGAKTVRSPVFRCNFPESALPKARQLLPEKNCGLIRADPAYLHQPWDAVAPRRGPG